MLKLRSKNVHKEERGACSYSSACRSIDATGYSYDPVVSGPPVSMEEVQEALLPHLERSDPGPPWVSVEGVTEESVRNSFDEINQGQTLNDLLNKYPSGCRSFKVGAFSRTMTWAIGPVLQRVFVLHLHSCSAVMSVQVLTDQ